MSAEEEKLRDGRGGEGMSLSVPGGGGEEPAASGCILRPLECWTAR